MMEKKEVFVTYTNTDCTEGRGAKGMNDYLKFRGKCKELSEAACSKDPSLTLVRGHYYCPIWNVTEPHWWTVRPDGSVFDPSAAQFPSKGIGEYIPFDGTITCEECGKKVPEKDAVTDGNHAVCSSKCFGRMVGVPLSGDKGWEPG